MRMTLSASRRGLRELAFGILLAVYFIASMTWAFKADPALLNFEFAYRLLLPLLLVLCFAKIPPSPKAHVVLFSYVLLVAYMFAVAAFSEAPAEVVVNTAKFLYPVLFFAGLAFVLHPRNFSGKILYAVAILGIIGAVQTLTLAVLFYSGHAPPLHTVILIGYKNMPMPSFGIFGYAWGSLALGTPYQVYRAQSFFGEPTRMASFMEIATIISIGLYKCERKRWQLAAVMLGALTVFACFSMTADIVALLTIGFYFVVTRWRRSGFVAPVVTLCVVVVLVVLVLAYLQTATSFYQESQSTINLALGHANTEVGIRVRFLQNTLKLVRDHPFGIGVIGVETSRILRQYPGAGDVIAPLVWLTDGGVIGLVLQLAILGFIYSTVIVRQILEGGLKRFVALAFVICTLHHCVAGDWMDSMFLFLLAAVIAFDRYQFELQPGMIERNTSRIRWMRISTRALPYPCAE